MKKFFGWESGLHAIERPVLFVLHRIVFVHCVNRHFRDELERVNMRFARCNMGLEEPE
jgi:hypothetical protein